MSRRALLLIGLIVVLLATSAAAALASPLAEPNPNAALADVRAATAAFHDPEAAKAAGWDLVPGLDYCFNKPGVGAMGFHYINVGLLDLEVDAAAPEAMVYEPTDNGRLKLAAVEYIVPAAAWDAAGNTALPSLYGRSFHLNAALGVYVLHAWIWKPNPAGIFEDYNPDVSCP